MSSIIFSAFDSGEGKHFLLLKPRHHLDKTTETIPACLTLKTTPAPISTIPSVCHYHSNPGARQYQAEELASLLLLGTGERGSILQGAYNARSANGCLGSCPVLLPGAARLQRQADQTSDAGSVPVGDPRQSSESELEISGNRSQLSACFPPSKNIL